MPDHSYANRLDSEYINPATQNRNAFPTAPTVSTVSPYSAVTAPYTLQQHHIVPLERQVSSPARKDCVQMPSESRGRAGSEKSFEIVEVHLSILFMLPFGLQYIANRDGLQMLAKVAV